jgi:hypothetical protein
MRPVACVEHSPGEAGVTCDAPARRTPGESSSHLASASSSSRPRRSDQRRCTTSSTRTRACSLGSCPQSAGRHSWAAAGPSRLSRGEVLPGKPPWAPWAPPAGACCAADPLPPRASACCGAVTRPSAAASSASCSIAHGSSGTGSGPHSSGSLQAAHSPRAISRTTRCSACPAC